MRPLFLFTACLLASPASATSTLLVEFAWNRAPEILPAPYVFVIRDRELPSGNDLAFIETTFSGVEVNNFTDTQTIAEFNRLLTRTNDTWLQVYFYNGAIDPFLVEGPGFDAVWFSFFVEPPYFYAAHVPRLGRGLFGYRITAIEQHITEARQSVYFYGEPVPEPGLAAMALTPLGIFLLMRAKRRC